MTYRKITYCLASFLFLVSWLSRADAVPRLDKMKPHAVRRGEEVRVEFHGADLLDPQDIVFYLPGIELIEWEAFGANRVAAVLQVAADCQPGPHAFRICTGRGISNLRTLSITDLPVVNEIEPNNQLEQAQLFEAPATLQGTLQNEDIDRFAIDLAAADSLTLEAEGLRLGREYLDPVITVTGPDGQTVVVSDDTPLTRQDPFCHFQASSAGRYLFEIRDVRFRGNGYFQYLLHVGKFPRPTYAWPSGGRPGETIQVMWRQPQADEWQQEINLPMGAEQLHDVFAANDQGVAPSANQLRVIDLAAAFEVEPNDAPSTGTPVTIPIAVHGVIAKAGDQDFFRFTAQKGQVLTANVFARRGLRSRLDALIAVRPLKGKQITSSDDNGGPDAYAEFTIPADGEYALLIRDHLAARRS